MIRMRVIFTFIIAFIAAYYYFSYQKVVALAGMPLDTKNQGQLEVCKNQKACLGVYLAPWCSACQSTISLINEIRSATNAGDINLQVIIGSDYPDNLRQFSTKIYGAAYLDSLDRFRSITEYSSVPRWFVINDKQEITDAFTLWHIPDGNAESKINYLRESYLGLSQQ